MVAPCVGNLGLERGLFLTFISLITVGLVKEWMTFYVSRTLKIGDMNPCQQNSEILSLKIATPFQFGHKFTSKN